MKVEVLKTFRHVNDKYNKGEIRIVDDTIGEYFCRAGWVKDLDGKVPTASPKTDEVVLVVQSVRKQAKVGTV